MKVSFRKGPATAIVVIMALSALAALGWFRAGMASIHSALADGRTQMLEEGRDAALLKTNVAEVASTLRWIGHFYRPTEIPRGSVERHHYLMMERIRTSYQRDLVQHLRGLTGTNLGDSPALWVEHFALPER